MRTITIEVGEQTYERLLKLSKLGRVEMGETPEQAAQMLLAVGALDSIVAYHEDIAALEWDEEQKRLHG